MANYSQFFQRYLDLCKEKNLEPMSQKAADSWGVQRATISMWAKNGNVPKGDIVANIAKGLNTSTDYLLGTSDVKADIGYWTKNGNENGKDWYIPITFKKVAQKDGMPDFQILAQWSAVLQKYSNAASENGILQLWKSLNEKNRQKVIGYMEALKELEDEEDVNE